ncbi:Uncharacterised protein [Bordetella ansorpii]|uniref:Uncharacterized protein n=1 Tax=Bordetella ansorpii TaxID=288768 RepID=A0A157PDS9_9BORD|nr:hypothetical protein [Bordetella ansorpii]SAI31627.1 Uncharacterised protein [Bordetella ansorpii]
MATKKAMVAKKVTPAKRSKSAAGSDAVDVNAILQSAIKSGLIKSDTTVAEVVAMAGSPEVGTLGYAMAWDRYVAVVK